MSLTLNKDGTLTAYDAAGKKLARGSVDEVFAFLKGTSSPVPARKPKKVKPKSRSQRWQEAATAAVAALEELADMQTEFSDWKDNLDGKFEGSALVEKLDAVCELDIEGAKSTAEECEGIDLPLGFGRD